MWDQVIATRPPRFLNDLLPAEFTGQLVRSGDELAYWQYYPAIARVIEIVRQSPARCRTPAAARRPRRRARSTARSAATSTSTSTASTTASTSRRPAPGIPLLLQHTAGSHGVQFRHLFEMPEITDHFRLIAYDLPFHGKSVPPDVGRRGGREPYRLTRELRDGPAVALAAALELDRPAFMGCSVGGLLALDLACYHPDVFRAVIALEPALKLDVDLDTLIGFWHPEVSNETRRG